MRRMWGNGLALPRENTDSDPDSNEVYLQLKSPYWLLRESVYNIVARSLLQHLGSLVVEERLDSCRHALICHTCLLETEYDRVGSSRNLRAVAFREPPCHNCWLTAEESAFRPIRQFKKPPTPGVALVSEERVNTSCRVSAEAGEDLKC
jgi:hypothetical protein